MLNKNARELLEFILQMQAHDGQPLTRKDMAIINAINTYANKFDVRGIKMIVKDHPNLLIRRDTPAYLNADAKIILEISKKIFKITFIFSEYEGFLLLRNVSPFSTMLEPDYSP